MTLAEIIQVYNLQEELDDMILDIKVAEAEVLKNLGTEAELEYLKDQGISEKDIRATLFDEDSPLADVIHLAELRKEG